MREALLQFGGAVAVSLLVAGCAKTEAKPEVTTATVPLLVAPPPPNPPTLLELAQRQTTLPGVLQVLTPKFNDTPDNGVDPASATLAIWGHTYMKWAELQALPETKHALVMKDSVAERGKRMCLDGSIVEIRVDRSGPAPVYFGGMISNAGNVLRFIAVGSTGALVANDVARFCGVVTGRESYSNSAGGMTHASHVVGMFGLPENKSR